MIFPVTVPRHGNWTLASFPILHEFIKPIFLLYAKPPLPVGRKNRFLFSTSHLIWSKTLEVFVRHLQGCSVNDHTILHKPKLFITSIISLRWNNFFSFFKYEYILQFFIFITIREIIIFSKNDRQKSSKFIHFGNGNGCE